MLNPHIYGMIVAVFIGSLLVAMLNKKFFDTEDGVKQIIAYELYENYGFYQKDIASLLGCSNNTVANYVKRIKKYKHLKDLQYILQKNSVHVQIALAKIREMKNLQSDGLDTGA